MTVRDATRRESPDGHVLYIEDLRKHLGLGSNAGESSSSATPPNAAPEVILIGHEMHGDFQNLERDRIDLPRHFHYSGCVDTHVIIEDTGAISGKSLSSLVSHYELAELEWKKPRCRGIPGKFSFVGSHCSGNDAIKTLESALAQALDPRVGTIAHNLPTDWFDKPLHTVNINMILLAYDTQTVETPNYKPKVPNRTSEHGFAWLHLAEVAHIAPGEYGCNWRPKIRARHWINQDFRNFKNRFYCVGNPNGFWPEYGRSQYYRVSKGPGPFHKLFEEIVSNATDTIEGISTVKEITTTLETTTLGDKSPVIEDHVADLRGGNLLRRGNSRRGRGSLRGKSGRGQGEWASSKAVDLNNEGKLVRGGGTSAHNRGSTPKSNGKFARGGGNKTSIRGRNPG